MKNAEIAKSYFKDGYNCAQSVLLTYADKFNIDKNSALKLASSFGGGMGRLREVCGAVSMMFTVAGLKCGYISNNDDIAKEKHYCLIQKLADEFKKEHKSIICRELLNIDEKISLPKPDKRTEEYYQNRPCENYIGTVCDIIDEFVLNE